MKMNVKLYVALAAFFALNILASVACLSRNIHQPPSLQDPAGAAQALRAACAEKDLNAVLALYEEDVRQQQLERIEEMRQRSATAENITEEMEEGVALAMVCIPALEPDLTDVQVSESKATVTYTYGLTSEIPVAFKIDFVQKDGDWMVVEVTWDPISKE